MILIFGPGWLGREYYDFLNREGYSAIISSANILDSIEVRKELMIYQPDVIINCAGKCGSPNIDWCEASDENRQLTECVNAFGPRVLFEAVRRETNVPFVHLSSGCLWDVDDYVEPLTEEETPDPPSWYSETKAAGERNLQGQDALVIRLRMPIDSKPHSRNMIDKLINYPYVLNVPNSVTTIDTLMRATLHLVKGRHIGVYNVVTTTTTGVELMELYREHVDPSHTFEPITKEQMYSKGLARSKRSNCRLSTSKLEATRFTTPCGNKDRILGELMRDYAKAARAQ